MWLWGTMQNHNDLNILQDKLKNRGYDLSKEEVFVNWRRFSERNFANWLNVNSDKSVDKFVDLNKDGSFELMLKEVD